MTRKEEELLKREHYKDRESWLSGRIAGLGASNSATAVGLNKWETNISLWKHITGRAQGKDLVGNTAVEFGVKAEPIVRELFKLKHPEIKVKYHQYDILYQSEVPWLRATLDGECVTDSPKRFGATNGILEIKTATLRTKQQWDDWNGKIPQNYYCQCCHQLLATGWDYVYLFALLMGQSEWCIREFYIDREDAQEDMNWLLNEEKKFWGYVERNEEPPEILPDI